MKMRGFWQEFISLIILIIMFEVSKSDSPTKKYSVLRTSNEIVSAFSEILQPFPITKTSNWPVLLVYLNFFYR